MIKSPQGNLKKFKEVFHTRYRLYRDAEIEQEARIKDMWNVEFYKIDYIAEAIKFIKCFLSRKSHYCLRSYGPANNAYIARTGLPTIFQVSSHLSLTFPLISAELTSNVLFYRILDLIKSLCLFTQHWQIRLAACRRACSI